jgi:hypothetical protein
MIALMFLAGIAAWVVVVIVLTVWIPRVLPPGWWRAIARLVLFPVLLVLPIADEWIGRKQFAALCKREDAMHLSPDWREVKRASDATSPYLKKLSGYAVRIEENEIMYRDMDTGKIFLRFSFFYNYGGFLMDKIGLRLSGAPPTCKPSNYYQVTRQIDLQKLLDQGSGK